ncbi:MAG: hypothetical protein J6A04_05360 [Clostridia bacterium]|nr:hypothetical protein [Clostridia bacterium]
MMFSYPYFNFPYYNRYSRYGYRYPNYKPYHNRVVTKPTPKPDVVVNKVPNETKKEERSSSPEDSPLFQIFGIDLYFDDILIVCLIFFLYQEGVKDESLFIALILLLLS